MHVHDSKSGLFSQKKKKRCLEVPQEVHFQCMNQDMSSFRGPICLILFEIHVRFELQLATKHQDKTRNSPDVLFDRSFNIGYQMFYICQIC